MQSFELMNWCCSEDADLYVAAQSVDNLSLHVIHVGFISDLLNSKWLVVWVKRCEASYCQRAVLVSDLTIVKVNVFSPHLFG